MKIKEKVLKDIKKKFIPYNLIKSIGTKDAGIIDKEDVVYYDNQVDEMLGLAFSEGEKSMDKSIFPKRKGYIIFDEDQYFKRKKEIEKEILAEVGKKHLEDLYELLNNLNDDLELDFKEGESGYKSYEASYQAVKRYTLKVLRRKIFELKKGFGIEVLKK